MSIIIITLTHPIPLTTNVFIGLNLTSAYT